MWPPLIASHGLRSTVCRHIGGSAWSLELVYQGGVLGEELVDRRVHKTAVSWCRLFYHLTGVVGARDGIDGGAR